MPTLIRMSILRLALFGALAVSGGYFHLSTPTLAQETVTTTVPASPSPAPATSGSPARPRHGAPLPHELSPWAMFLAADIVVKGVMSLLAAASVLCWAIWFAKLWEIATAKRRTISAIAALRNRDRLERVGQTGSRNVIGVMLAAAEREMARSGATRDAHAGIKERLSSELHRIELAAGRQIAGGTGMLATIGATAPFIGLFGTVWGIMNSFIGISKSQTTNLAVVAPGIAEALLATAIGLVAAIPAVIFYNQIVRGIAGYKALVADGSALVQRTVSRELDLSVTNSRLRAAAE